MNTKETPNYFEKMSYMQDFWCMCWDDKFLDKEEIKDRCHCSDLVKRSCLALCDLLRSKDENKERTIHNFINITKEHLRREFNLNK